MALKQRLICKLLIENGVAVKYKRFTESRRVVGDPVSLMRTLEDQKLDEFYICFLGAVDTSLVQRMTDNAFCPVTMAGSINDIATVDTLLRDCGVEKVVIKNDELGWKISARYGNQACVWAVDYTGDAVSVTPPEWAGEILLTSIDRDGMGTGFDLSALGRRWTVPVVIAGGCGKLAHVRDALAAGASGVAISSLFAFSDKSPIKLRSWLVSSGCNVRAA